MLADARVEGGPVQHAAAYSDALWGGGQDKVGAHLADVEGDGVPHRVWIDGEERLGRVLDRL